MNKQNRWQRSQRLKETDFTEDVMLTKSRTTVQLCEILRFCFLSQAYEN